MGNTESAPPPRPNTARRQSSVKAGADLGYLARAKRAEDARKEAIATNTHDDVKENQQLLKKLFKRLDPSVSKVDTDVQGEIQVSLKYDFQNSKLLVNIIKCRDLGLNDITGKTAEPFVSLSLYPNPDRIDTKQTSTSSKSQNPVFNEKFSFPMEEESLPDQHLILKVIDQDLVNNEMDFLGETNISLDDFNFVDSPVHTAWYTLQPETDLTISGELDIGLNYNLPGTLLITIHQASNLKLNHLNSPPDAAVKVGVPGIDQIEVTEVKRQDTNPCWEETFSFEVPREELAMRYVVLTAIDRGSEDDSLLGHVVIDLDNLDIDSGYRGFFPLSDMSHNDRLRSKWFQTTQVQEFREALWAHSFFHYPKMLFRNHTGKTVVRLTCQSGGAKAKLRLNNGIPYV